MGHPVVNYSSLTEILGDKKSCGPGVALIRADAETLKKYEMDQHERIAKLEMKEILYVKKFDDGSRATVVVLTKPGLVVRGYAICIPRDQYVKSVGRILARARALRAVTNKRSGGHTKVLRVNPLEPPREEVCMALHMVDAMGGFKWIHSAVLTPEESALAARIR